MRYTFSVWQPVSISLALYSLGSSSPCKEETESVVLRIVVRGARTVDSLLKLDKFLRLSELKTQCRPTVPVGRETGGVLPRTFP
jgi:hypothetical protein